MPEFGLGNPAGVFLAEPLVAPFADKVVDRVGNESRHPYQQIEEQRPQASCDATLEAKYDACECLDLRQQVTFGAKCADIGVGTG